MRHGHEWLRNQAARPFPRGQSGREKRPHLADDEGIVGPATRKEVSYGSVYHTAASLPTPSPPEPDGTPAGVGPRGGPPQGHHHSGPQRGGGHLEVDPLHPLGDLLDLLLADAQPRSLLPVRPQAVGRLDGAPRSEARRRGHQPVLQGPGPAARIRPAAADAAGSVPSRTRGCPRTGDGAAAGSRSSTAAPRSWRTPRPTSGRIPRAGRRSPAWASRSRDSW